MIIIIIQEYCVFEYLYNNDTKILTVVLLNVRSVDIVIEFEHRSRLIFSSCFITKRIVMNKHAYAIIL